MPDTEDFLNPRQAAEYIGLAYNTLNVYRCRNMGPAWHRLDSRVVYRRSDLDRWREQSPARRKSS